jgi:hypothetical protein
VRRASCEQHCSLEQEARRSTAAMETPHTHEAYPLRKEVPGQLLQFEEKIFGMSLTQLLTGLAAAISFLALTPSMSLPPRIVAGIMLMSIVLTLVHGKVGRETTLSWLCLLVRFRFLPRHSVFRSPDQPRKRGESASVQQSWIRLDRLEQGIASVITPWPHRDVPEITSWAVLEVHSLQQVRLLAEDEQVRLYERFQRFLDGLGFPLICLSLVHTTDAQQHPAFVAQQQVLTAMSTTPRLQRLQQASLAHQQSALAQCSSIRHLVIVSASTRELALSHSAEATSSPWSRLFRLLLPGKRPVVLPEQVTRELQQRLSLVKQACRQLEVEVMMLDDAQLLQVWTSCLAPGASLPLLLRVSLHRHMAPIWLICLRPPP